MATVYIFASVSISKLSLFWFYLIMTFDNKMSLTVIILLSELQLQAQMFLIVEK